MPKTCACIENQTIYFLSKQEFIIDSQIQVSGVPLSDCFIAYMRWKISGEEITNIEVFYGVDFIKSTMFKKKIESTGIEKSKTAINTTWIPLVKRKMLELKGNIQFEPIIIPQPKIEETTDYRNIIFFAILACVIVYMWLRIKALQNRVDDMEKIIGILSLKINNK